jgi:hypothetical protein
MVDVMLRLATRGRWSCWNPKGVSRVVRQSTQEIAMPPARRQQRRVNLSAGWYKGNTERACPPGQCLGRGASSNTAQARQTSCSAVPV